MAKRDQRVHDEDAGSQRRSSEGGRLVDDPERDDVVGRVAELGAVADDGALHLAGDERDVGRVDQVGEVDGRDQYPV